MKNVEMSLAEMKRTMKQREEVWKRQEASLQQKVSQVAAVLVILRESVIHS